MKISLGEMAGDILNESWNQYRTTEDTFQTFMTRNNLELLISAISTKRSACQGELSFPGRTVPLRGSQPTLDFSSFCGSIGSSIRNL